MKKKSSLPQHAIDENSITYLHCFQKCTQTLKANDLRAKISQVVYLLWKMNVVGWWKWQNHCKTTDFQHFTISWKWKSSQGGRRYCILTYPKFKIHYSFCWFWKKSTTAGQTRNRPWPLWARPAQWTGDPALPSPGQALKGWQPFDAH